MLLLAARSVAQHALWSKYSFFVSSTYTKRMFMIVACYRTMQSGATHRIFNVANTKGDMKGGVPKAAAPARILLPCRLSD